MTKKYVKVTRVGFFEIKEKDLKDIYEAETFEEAVENQRLWIEDGSAPPDELCSEGLPSTVDLELVDELPEW